MALRTDEASLTKSSGSRRGVAIKYSSGNIFAANRVYGHRAMEVFFMDWNRVEGNWKQVKGKVKEKWGQLTDDDLDMINGRRDQLEGKIQERYGLAKDQIRKDVRRTAVVRTAESFDRGPDP
jgi:uncharacterized protein YjbJ (UPF0337 family)